MNKASALKESDISRKEILIPKTQIKQRLEEIGLQISEDYKGKELHLVGVLNGAFIFLADLARQLKIPCKICFLQYLQDQIHLNEEIVLKARW